MPLCPLPLPNRPTHVTEETGFSPRWVKGPTWGATTSLSFAQEGRAQVRTLPPGDRGEVPQPSSARPAWRGQKEGRDPKTVPFLCSLSPAGTLLCDPQDHSPPPVTPELPRLQTEHLPFFWLSVCLQLTVEQVLFPASLELLSQEAVSPVSSASYFLEGHLSHSPLQTPSRGPITRYRAHVWNQTNPNSPFKSVTTGPATFMGL